MVIYQKNGLFFNSKRYLYKGSSRPFNQEAINEFIASKILERVNISHVDYSYDKQCSLCPCFIDENTEYVPAWNVFMSKKRKNSENSYQYFQRITEELSIECKNFVDNMLIFDYLIANEDRRFNNFGFILDVNTLKIISFAPLFDNGNSLWYKSNDSKIGEDVNSKPFTTDFQKQLAYVTNKTDLDLSFDFTNIIQKSFLESGYSEIRSNKTISAVKNRQDRILQL